MTELSPESLIARACEAMQQAHCPYSHFAVGAALLADDGTVIGGCNVENASFGLTLCAERAALVAAVARGIRAFAAMAIVAGGSSPPYPCGACRQVMVELCPGTMPVYVARADDPDEFESFTVSSLLPHTFALPAAEHL